MVMLSARRTDHFQRRGNGERGARAVCSAGTDFIFTGADAEYDDYSVVDCRAGAGVGIPVYEAVYPSTASGAGRGVWLVDSMAFAAVSESVPLSCWLMFLANILWAVAYDTQYAMVDRDDDVKIGIKSTAILFGQYDKLIIGIFQIGVLALMAIIGELNGLGWGYYWSILVAGALFVYQQN